MFYNIFNNECAKDCIEQFIKIAKGNKGNYNFSAFEGIDFIIEDLLRNINRGAHSRFKNQYIDVVLDYVGWLMDNNPNAITEYGFISHLYQFTQKEKEDEELAYRLKKFFDNRIHKEEADIKVFTPYKEKLDNFVGMSVDEFNSFLNVAVDYRNKTGMFPENVCDYIIKQCIIHKKGFGELTKEIKERVIEDKAGYLVKEKGHDNTLIVCSTVSDQFFKKKTSDGEYFSNGFIRIRSDKKGDWFEKDNYRINDRDNIRIKILNILFHELRHDGQFDQEIKYYYNPVRYKMIKEDIICKYMKEYKDINYVPIFVESDARIYSSIDTIQYLKKLKFTEEELKEAGLSDFEELVEDNVIDAILDEEKSDKRYDPFENKYRNMEDIFQDLVKREVNGTLFCDFPIIRLEYDIFTGARKGNMVILENYQLSRLSEKLYKKKKKNDVTLSNATILDDIEKLLKFTPEYPETEELRNYILCEKILPRVREWAVKGKVDLNPFNSFTAEEMDEIEKEHFEKAKDKLLAFARLHPEFSKDIEFLTMPEKDNEAINLSDLNSLFSPDAFLKSIKDVASAGNVLHSLNGNEEKKTDEDDKENGEGEGRKADE